MQTSTDLLSTVQTFQSFMYGFGACVGLVVCMGGILFTLLITKFKNHDESIKKGECNNADHEGRIIKLETTCERRCERCKK